ASGDGAGLSAAAERFAERGLRLAALDAATAAVSAFADAGLRREESRAAARRRRLTAECTGMSGPDVDGPPVLRALSRREREVATLAAAGLSDAEIVERLVLSVRTVESHLYQAYAKLGVRRRDDLADAVGPAAGAGKDQ